MSRQLSAHYVIRPNGVLDFGEGDLLVSRIWTGRLARQCEGYTTRFERTLRACPDELWEASMWPVPRAEIEGIWPSGVADSMAEVERFLALSQVFSTFWLIAYHAIGHVEQFLALDPDVVWEVPAAFGTPDDRPVGPVDAFLREIYERGGGFEYSPWRVYTRDEMLAYTEVARLTARANLGGLSDEEAEGPCRRDGPPDSGGSFAQMLSSYLSHGAYHLGQMEMFLGQHGVSGLGY